MGGKFNSIFIRLLGNKKTDGAHEFKKVGTDQEVDWTCPHGIGMKYPSRVGMMVGKGVGTERIEVRPWQNSDEIEGKEEIKGVVSKRPAANLVRRTSAWELYPKL